MKNWRVWLFIVTAGVIIAATINIRLFETDRKFASSISAIEACARLSDSVTCARPYIRELLEFKSGTEVVDALESRLEPQVCHYMTHIVGQQLYKKFERIEPALAECSRGCALACTHGILGEAFAKEIGADEVADVSHLSIDDIKKSGKKLCTSESMCHGVGHSLFQIFGEFAPAVSICADLATGMIRTYCYRGIFMEYADIISSRNFKDAPEITMPDPLKPAELCDQDDPESLRACLRYFPRVSIELQKRVGVKEKDAVVRANDTCELLEDKLQRRACIAGIGVFYAPLVFSDTKRAIGICEAYPQLDDGISCILGIISSALEYHKPDELIKFCASFNNTSLKQDCYDVSYFLAVQFEGPGVTSNASCSASDEYCKKAVAKTPGDPWDIWSD